MKRTEKDIETILSPDDAGYPHLLVHEVDECWWEKIEAR